MLKKYGDWQPITTVIEPDNASENLQIQEKLKKMQEKLAHETIVPDSEKKDKKN